MALLVSGMAAIVAYAVVRGFPNDDIRADPGVEAGSVLRATFAGMVLSPVAFFGVPALLRTRTRTERLFVAAVAQLIIALVAMTAAYQELWERALRGGLVVAAAAAGVLVVAWRLPRYLEPKGPRERLLSVLATDALLTVSAVAILGGLDTPRAFAAAGVGALVAALAAFWWVPQWQATGWTQIDGKDRVELEDKARATVAQLLGGLGLIATVAITLFQVNEARRASDQTLRLTARAQVNDRFSRAIDQLGAREGGKPSTERRLGGIYALEQYVRQSETASSSDDAATAYRTGASILSAYLRSNSPRDHFIASVPLPPQARCEPGKRRLAPDIEAVLIVLRDLYPASDALRGTGYRAEGPSLDLSNTDLSGANLSDLDLRGADLENAHLELAVLQNANLESARLAGVDARRACFKWASAEDANLVTTADRASESELRRTAANLEGSVLSSSNFQYAKMRYVNLSHADVEFTDFFGAELGGANVDGVDLASADNVPKDIARPRAAAKKRPG